MAFDNSYTAVTGGTLSAAEWNTHVRDNFTAIFVGTTAGDFDYYTGATAKARLAKPASGIGLLKHASTDTAPSYFGASSSDAYRLVGINSSGSNYSLFGGQVKLENHNDTTGHTYTSSTPRDMPNSSKSITVEVTSTIKVNGHVMISTSTGNQQFNVYVDIDGNSDASTRSYVAGASLPGFPVPFEFSQSGITAGSKTVKLKEFQTYNGNQYTVYWLNYDVLIIPE